MEGAGAKDVSAAVLGSSGAEALTSRAPDAVTLYPNGDGRNEPTQGSMTLPLCHLPYLNTSGCFSAVSASAPGLGTLYPPGQFSLVLHLPAVLC